MEYTFFFFFQFIVSTTTHTYNFSPSFDNKGLLFWKQGTSVSKRAKTWKQMPPRLDWTPTWSKVLLSFFLYMKLFLKLIKSYIYVATVRKLFFIHPKTIFLLTSTEILLFVYIFIFVSIEILYKIVLQSIFLQIFLKKILSNFPFDVKLL